MNKTELLAAITEAARAGTITEQELRGAFKNAVAAPDASELSDALDSDRHDRNITISRILYYIGGAVVLIGLVTLVVQNWREFSDSMRVISTLGASFAFYISAVLLSKSHKFDQVGQVFYGLSAALLPIGLFIAFDIAGYDTETSQVNTLISLIGLVMFGLSLRTLRKTIFIPFTIIYGTWFFVAVTNLMVENQVQINLFRFYAYRFFAIGITYLLLGYFLVQKKVPEISRWLYPIGSFIALLAALILGGWSPSQNLFWEIIYPGLTFGAMFLSISFKSRSLLIFGSLFFMCFLLKITAEYFANTIGWPLALVILGFALIAVGYATVQINNKYLTRQS